MQKAPVIANEGFAHTLVARGEIEPATQKFSIRHTEALPSLKGPQQIPVPVARLPNSITLGTSQAALSGLHFSNRCPNSLTTSEINGQ